MTRLDLARAMLALLAGLALAGPACASDVSVEGAWARATAPNAKTSAVYLSIVSKAADKLIGASTPVAGQAQVHETYRHGDVVGMRPVDDLPLSTTGPTVLAPGGYHIMLMGLNQRLLEGSSFPLTLSFKTAGKLSTTVHVEAAGANGPMQDLGPGHDMDSMSDKSH